MSGLLSDTPDGATLNAQVANTCLPAGLGLEICVILGFKTREL